MKKILKTVWIIGIILVLCIVEVAIIKSFAGEKEMVEVYVAASDIKSNQIVTKDMLMSKTYPADSIPAFVVKEKDEVIGKSTLAKIRRGEIVSPTRVSEKPAINGPDKGKFLFALKPNPENVIAWQIKKGDRVTVLGVPKGATQKDHLQIKNIKVNSLINSEFKPDGRKPTYVLLETSLEQAQLLARLSLSGDLRILAQS